jgi:hypothetical protein
MACFGNATDVGESLQVHMSMADLVVRELKQTEWDHWDEWLALQPWASPFSSAWWLEANCRAFGGRPLLLAVSDGEQLAGGVALRITDLGVAHIVRPSILYNPIVLAAGSMRRRQEILAALLGGIVRQNLVVRALSCTPDMVDLRQAVWHDWCLTVSWTAVIALQRWRAEEAVSGGELKQMKRAQRRGITTAAEPPDADVLYDLMTATMTRHSMKEEMSRRQLRVLIEGAGTHGMQTVARDVDGTPLSACFVMAHGPRVVYGIWAGTSALGLTRGAAVARDVFRLRHLGEQGYEYFDWCGASFRGISDYKLKFGGVLKTHFAVSREPVWFRTMVPVYAGIKRILGRP